MSKIEVRVYQSANGKVPFREWFIKQPKKVQQKCIERISRLKECGFELVRNRIEAAHLGKGIYELRFARNRVNYRILYFFYGNVAAIISHGLTKERAIPQKDFELALSRKNEYEANPEQHTFWETP